MKDEIKTLSTIEHIKQRPNLWIGSVAPSKKENWILNDDDTLSYKEVTFTEGLLKICNEAIDNSVDCGIKTDWKYSTKISIDITNDTFTCEDNGIGIPVKKNEDNEWIPVVATCIPMSGSNFSDDNRTSIGANGVGIKAANIFSKSFECVTCDGKGKLKISCKNNLSSTKVTELTATNKTGTKITFSPDFNRFGVKDFSPELKALIKTRLKFLSWFFPKCSFTFNGEKVNIKAKDIASLFPDNSVVLNDPNVYICVYPSDEPFVLSYVNGISLRRGGTHVDYVVNKIVTDIREKVSKKFKNIKPADIKNRLGIVVFFNNFPNCAFDSQTKETLTNSQSNITDFFQKNQTDLDVLSTKILKNKVILDNITDIFKAKEEIAANKEAEKKSNKRDFDSNKYFPPIGKSGEKYLMITEGQSAFSGISPILGRKGIGYYMLMGKPANILDETPSKFMEHREIAEIIQVLGLSPTRPNENIDMTYDKVVILSDADADGTAIAGLIISIFSKIAPKMLEEGRICRMETPLLIGLGKGDKVEEYYFSFPEKSKMKSNLEYKYLKGLGSWTKGRLNQVIEKEGGMDGLIRPYKIDETTLQTIQEWFGKETIARKDALRGREFHIDIA